MLDSGVKLLGEIWCLSLLEVYGLIKDTQEWGRVGKDKCFFLCDEKKDELYSH